MGRLFSACNSTFDNGDDGDDGDDVDYDDDCGNSAPLFCITQIHFQTSLNLDLKQQRSLCKKKLDWKHYTNITVFDNMRLGELFHLPSTRFTAFATFIAKVLKF